jgi:hypothetical protein
MSETQPSEDHDMEALFSEKYLSLRFFNVVLNFGSLTASQPNQDALLGSCVLSSNPSLTLSSFSTRPSCALHAQPLSSSLVNFNHLLMITQTNHSLRYSPMGLPYTPRILARQRLPIASHRLNAESRSVPGHLALTAFPSLLSYPHLVSFVAYIYRS